MFHCCDTAVKLHGPAIGWGSALCVEQPRHATEPTPKCLRPHRSVVYPGIFPRIGIFSRGHQGGLWGSGVLDQGASVSVAEKTVLRVAQLALDRS